MHLDTLINVIILVSNTWRPALNLVTRIRNEIRHLNMLQHPFYQDWMKGKLSREQLQHYAVQYAPFVDAFPRFVSSVHSRCLSSEGRKLLLENLMDEEGLGYSKPHPILWRQFAFGLDAKIDDVEVSIGKKLEERFFELCGSSYEEGLCALYAYEHQIPEIARAKINGLEKSYAISDSATLEFFKVHETADIYHSRACESLIDLIDSEKTTCAINAAKESASSLWNFLTEVHSS